MPRSDCPKQAHGSTIVPTRLETASSAASEVDTESIRHQFDAARQTVDLLEADLAVMIRDVQNAVGVVRQTVQKSA